MPPDHVALAFAMFVARAILGLMFLMAGVWKVVRLGPREHARRFFVDPYAASFLPRWALWAVGVSIPFVELVAGGLVLLGLFTLDALIALGAILVVVTFGHLLADPLYSFQAHVMPRTLLLLFVLSLPREVDRFSVDAAFRTIVVLACSKAAELRSPPECYTSRDMRKSCLAPARTALDSNGHPCRTHRQRTIRWSDEASSCVPSSRFMRSSAPR